LTIDAKISLLSPVGIMYASLLLIPKAIFDPICTAIDR
jgi:hypothetical protein